MRFAPSAAATAAAAGGPAAAGAAIAPLLLRRPLPSTAALSTAAAAAAAPPPPRRGRVHIITHGCQMNSSDSDLVARILSDHGYDTAASSVDEADAVLINTW